MAAHKWVKMVKTILYKPLYWVCSACGAIAWFKPDPNDNSVCSEKEI